MDWFAKQGLAPILGDDSTTVTGIFYNKTSHKLAIAVILEAIRRVRVTNRESEELVFKSKSANSRRGIWPRAQPKGKALRQVNPRSLFGYKDAMAIVAWCRVENIVRCANGLEQIAIGATSTATDKHIVGRVDSSIRYDRNVHG